MTKEENRAKYPIQARWVDDFRKTFGEDTRIVSLKSKVFEVRELRMISGFTGNVYDKL